MQKSDSLVGSCGNMVFVEHVWIDVVVSGYSAWCKVDIAVVCVRRSMRMRIVGIGSAVPSTLVRKCAG